MWVTCLFRKHSRFSTRPPSPLLNVIPALSSLPHCHLFLSLPVHLQIRACHAPWHRYYQNPHAGNMQHLGPKPHTGRTLVWQSAQETIESRRVTGGKRGGSDEKERKGDSRCMREPIAHAQMSRSSTGVVDPLVIEQHEPSEAFLVVLGPSPMPPSAFAMTTKLAQPLDYNRFDQATISVTRTSCVFQASQASPQHPMFHHCDRARPSAVGPSHGKSSACSRSTIA